MIMQLLMFPDRVPRSKSPPQPYPVGQALLWGKAYYLQPCIASLPPGWLWLVVYYEIAGLVPFNTESEHLNIWLKNSYIYSATLVFYSSAANLPDLVVFFTLFSHSNDMFSFYTCINMFFIRYLKTYLSEWSPTVGLCSSWNSKW